MRAWPLALVLGGCGFSGSGLPDNQGGNKPPIDAPDEGSGSGSDVDAGVVHVCLGTFVNVCVDAPRSSLTLTNQTINTADTSAASKCLPYTATPTVDACVIASQSITIPSGQTVQATGAKRLILLAVESLTIAGTLDASSRRGGRIGPAADTGPCPTNQTPPTNVGQGGGGWGGTFGAAGNNGGQTPGGGLGGIAGSTLNITALGGGCRGGKGAGGDNAGDGGHGGGAVLLLAGQAINIPGTVNASGAGGNGARTNANGGGGGGSGGMIVLEAPTVGIPGKCFANGGGGGEASSAADGRGGEESTAPNVAGAGGKDSSPAGGDGGAGGIGTTGSKPGSNGGTVLGSAGGGGAGGGGVGIIHIISDDQQQITDPQKISPLPKS